MLNSGLGVDPRTPSHRHRNRLLVFGNLHVLVVPEKASLHQNERVAPVETDARKHKKKDLFTCLWDVPPYDIMEDEMYVAYGEKETTETVVITRARYDELAYQSRVCKLSKTVCCCTGAT